MISQIHDKKRLEIRNSSQLINKLNRERSTTNNSKNESFKDKTSAQNTREKFAIYKAQWLVELKKKKEKFEENWHNPPKNNASFDDFILLRTLGQGSFGRVILTKHKKISKPFALKIMPKKKIFANRQIEHTLNEKKILAALNFDYIVSLAYSFTDNANLFLALEFVSGGEMFTHLRKCKYFSEARTKFYIAQIVLAIEYLHSLDILHRDLKPENTLIGLDGYIKITDFGFAKVVKTRTFTFCGTPEYLAPEILAHQIYGKAVDWWTIGSNTFIF
jgi:protein kinase A